MERPAPSLRKQTGFGYRPLRQMILSLRLRRQTEFGLQPVQNQFRQHMTDANKRLTSHDLVLREISRIKDALSAAYGHNVDRLFDEARKRQDESGRPAVNFTTKTHKAR